LHSHPLPVRITAVVANRSRRVGKSQADARRGTAGAKRVRASRVEITVDFAQLMQRLQAGNEDAAREIHQRYTPGLLALARRQLSTSVRGKVDPESVVQSVYGSFFQRHHDQEFPDLGDWNDLWGLLTVITLRKCANRRRYHHQARRDVRREGGHARRAEDSGTPWEPADHEPTPHEAAVFTETLDQMLDSLEGRERDIIELLLQGHTVEEVRCRVGCGERTVRRVRDRVRQKLRDMGLAPQAS
jgi:RNA polymerase sigma-70 factor (ECF subfamily)